METRRSIARAFLDAWCTRDFDALDQWVDAGVIDTLRNALPTMPLEVRLANVTAVDEGLQFRFRFRLPSASAEGHVVEERVLVHTDGERVTAVDLFGTRFEGRVRELVSS